MKIEFTGPKQIREFIFIYQVVLKKTENFNDPNKVLLVLGWRTSTHREDYNCFYQPRFQMYCESKILLKSPLSEGPLFFFITERMA